MMNDKIDDQGNELIKEKQHIYFLLLQLLL